MWPDGAQPTRNRRPAWSIGQRSGSGRFGPPAAARSVAAHPALEGGVGARPGVSVEGARTAGAGIGARQHDVAPAFEALSALNMGRNQARIMATNGARVVATDAEIE